jgi:hypothetical protein
VRFSRVLSTASLRVSERPLIAYIFSQFQTKLRNDKLGRQTDSHTHNRRTRLSTSHMSCSKPNSRSQRPLGQKTVKFLVLYQYFCSGCGSSLVTSKNLVDPAKVRSWFNSTCPSCRTNLSNNVRWRQVNSDDLQSETPLPIESSVLSSHLPVNFRRVSEIQAEPHLSFGDENLDRFLGNLCFGYAVFLYGSWQCLAVSELLCIRAQLNFHRGGLNSETIFLDGGNTFDPYLIAQYAEQFSLDRNHALDRIFVARAFTCHQLTSLITQVLPEATRRRRAKLVVASDIIELYRDPDVHCTQSLNSFRTALNSLVTTARFEKFIILATSLNERISDSDPFLRVIKQRVDIILRFEERRHSTKLIVVKHPALSGESFLIKHPTPRVLEAFLETPPSG